MSSDKSSGKSQAVKVFISLEHACGYYPDRIAQNLVLDPIAEGQRLLYDAAITRGFRRGGGHIYRPHCANCSACVASRIDVLKFSLTRAQRRCLKRNADLRIVRRPAVHTEEYFALYQRYRDAELQVAALERQSNSARLSALRMMKASSQTLP